jgi:methionyl-tRNA formyltransferase
VTVFKLVDKMDAGPILIRRFTAIGPNETTGELHDRLAGIACDALHAALDLLQTQPDYAAEEQDESEVSLAPKLNKSDGSVDWTQSADQIVNHCRAMTPWPGARTRFIPQEGKPIEISLEAVSASPTSSNLEPGTLTDILSVSTGSGTLEVHGLQPAGGKSMSWQEFVNGRHVQPGDRFETLGRD